MWEYVTWRQIGGMGIVFCTLWLAIGLRTENVILFWAAPAILSTLQLFYFGTYLPHRERRGGYSDRHHSTTSGLPRWLSLVTCYHFGYHWEHHEYPYIPWWKLGRLRATLKPEGPKERNDRSQGKRGVALGSWAHNDPPKP